MEIKKLIDEALKEDIGSGDVTTDAIVPENLKQRAFIVAKQDLILAGLPIAQAVFKRLDRRCLFVSKKKDGARVKKGETIARLQGNARAILTGERVALNFLQRLSGIATLTNRYVKTIAKTKTKIYDTRKTTPGWRALEKYAVKVGGGVNHRMGLYDRYLIKNNHVDIAGSVSKAIEKILRQQRRRSRRKKIPLEVEVRNLKELKEALRCPIDLALLDNFSPAQIRQALRLKKRGVIFEASGGMNLKNINSYTKLGIDFISVGRLTHSPPAVDIHLIID